MFGLTAIEVFIAIVIIFIVLYWITPQRFSWFPLIVITVLFAVLAYNMTPNDADDLMRYYHEINYMRSDGFRELERAINDDVYEFNTYRVCAYYFYFISRFPNNDWLQTVTIFIVYGLMFLVIYKASRHFNVDKLNTFLGIMFFISTYWYYDVASGIRNGLAFTVACACAYYHLVERKNIILCYVGYLLVCFMHPTGFIPVVLAIITEITLNTSGKFFNFLLLFGIVGGGAILKSLSERTNSSFIQSVAGEAESHMSATIFVAGTMGLVNFSALLIVTFFLIYVSYYFLHGDYTPQLKRLFKFSSINIYFMIGSAISNILLFFRLTRWILPIIGTLLFMIGMQIQGDQIKKEGIVKLTYYTPLNQSIRIKTRSVVYILYTAYTAVHFWYLCAGSSLHWIMF